MDLRWSCSYRTLLAAHLLDRLSDRDLTDHSTTLLSVDDILTHIELPECGLIDMMLVLMRRAVVMA